MPAAKPAPERKSRSGSYIPDSLRHGSKFAIRCSPELAELARATAKASGQPMAQMLRRGIDATGCRRNVADPDDDPSPPFRIAYRPCGALPIVDVRWSTGECCMCHEHAREAEEQGCEVDWPEA